MSQDVQPPEGHLRVKGQKGNEMRVQLPNDAVSVGYKEVRPYHHEQLFSSETAGFTGTEREFVKAGHGYAYEQLDAYTRRVLRQ